MRLAAGRAGRKKKNRKKLPVFALIGTSRGAIRPLMIYSNKHPAFRTPDRADVHFKADPTERLSCTSSFQMKALSTNDNTIHQAHFVSAFATPTLFVPVCVRVCKCSMLTILTGKVTQFSFSSRALHYFFMCLKHQLYFIKRRLAARLILHY